MGYRKYKCLSDASFKETVYSDSSCSTTSSTATYNHGVIGNCSKAPTTYNKLLAKCGASASCTQSGSSNWYNKLKCVVGGSGSSSGSSSGAPITAIWSSPAVLAIVAFQAR